MKTLIIILAAIILIMFIFYRLGVLCTNAVIGDCSKEDMSSYRSTRRKKRIGPFSATCLVLLLFIMWIPLSFACTLDEFLGIAQEVTLFVLYPLFILLCIKLIKPDFYVELDNKIWYTMSKGGIDIDLILLLMAIAIIGLFIVFWVRDEFTKQHGEYFAFRIRKKPKTKGQTQEVIYQKVAVYTAYRNLIWFITGQKHRIYHNFSAELSYLLIYILEDNYKTEYHIKTNTMVLKRLKKYAQSNKIKITNTDYDKPIGEKIQFCEKLVLCNFENLFKKEEMYLIEFIPINKKIKSIKKCEFEKVSQ